MTDLRPRPDRTAFGLEQGLEKAFGIEAAGVETTLVVHRRRYLGVRTRGPIREVPDVVGQRPAEFVHPRCDEFEVGPILETGVFGDLLVVFVTRYSNN